MGISVDAALETAHEKAHFKIKMSQAAEKRAELVPQTMVVENIPNIKAVRLTPKRDRFDSLRIVVVKSKDIKTFILNQLPKRLWGYKVDFVDPSEIVKEFLKRFKIDILYLVPVKSERPIKYIKIPRFIKDGPTRWHCLETKSAKTKQFKLYVLYREGCISLEPYGLESGFYLNQSNVLTQVIAADADSPFKIKVIVDPSVDQELVGTPLWNTETSPILLESVDELQSSEDYSYCYLMEEDPFGRILLSMAYDVDDYCIQLVDRLRKSYDVITDSVQKQKSKLREKSLEREKDSYRFKIGDRAWLTVPLKGAAQREGLPEKFLFRWVGPVRIITVLDTENGPGTQISVVETFPGQEIAVRKVHVSRLRPYTVRVPVDSAEDAAILAGDDYETEIARWKKSKRLTRRPVGDQKIADATDVEWLRRYDDEFDEEDISRPLYEVEKILNAGFDEIDRKYKYYIKWKGFSNRHNSWNNEEDLIHTQELVEEYWDSIKKSKPVEYKERKLYEAKTVSPNYRIADEGSVNPPIDVEENLEEKEMSMPKKNDALPIPEEDSQQSQGRLRKRQVIKYPK